MTVTPKKHHKNVHKLGEIRQQLIENDPSKHMMIFVVPKSRLKTFQYNKKLSSISQYVMVDESVVPKKRKRHQCEERNDGCETHRRQQVLK
mmetsp:Transcript_11526/g.15872  ORF Transcript_11526/g.15872 Transcript_11526/m.15872 type:complete len:91 (+) Transcript_11526:511-783(+)